MVGSVTFPSLAGPSLAHQRHGFLCRDYSRSCGILSPFHLTGAGTRLFLITSDRQACDIGTFQLHVQITRPSSYSQCVGHSHRPRKSPSGAMRFPLCIYQQHVHPDCPGLPERQSNDICRLHLSTWWPSGRGHIRSQFQQHHCGK
jgi:hypothetical protein